MAGTGELHRIDFLFVWAGVLAEVETPAAVRNVVTGIYTLIYKGAAESVGVCSIKWGIDGRELCIFMQNNAIFYILI